MKPIEKDELFNHVSGFLKTRGIELKDGSYANRIQKTCSLMADAINLGQQGFERARTEFDKRLDQLRQVIHEKTAPNPPVVQTSPPSTAEAAQTAAETQTSSGSTGSAARKSQRKKTKHSKSRGR
jgi:hypothetical protein